MIVIICYDKELLDLGVITREEVKVKKKQINDLSGGSLFTCEIKSVYGVKK